MQLACLRLMLQHMTGPEIARHLEISKSTVESHLAQARATLGVSRSSEAARMLRAFEDERGSCDPSSDIAPVAPGAVPPPVSASPGSPSWRVLLPFRLDGATDNELTVRQRLFWIVVLAVAIALCVGAVANVLRVINEIAIRRR